MAVQPITPIAREALIRNIVQRVAEALRPEAILLFGSHASGNAREHSDIDLLVIMPNQNEFSSIRLDLFQRAYNALRGIEESVDFLIYTRDEVNERHAMGWDVVSTAVREGRMVYAEER